MGKQVHRSQEEIAAQKINSAAYSAIWITRSILEDISKHIIGLDNIQIDAIRRENKPAFQFKSTNSDTEALFNSFWQSLLQTKTNTHETYDDDEKIFIFDQLTDIPDYIDAFLAQYTGKIAFEPPLQRIVPKKVDDLTPEDLLLLKRDSYLGAPDVEQAFIGAQKVVGKNPLTRFTYLPYDLRRSVQAVIYAIHGNTKYSTDNVFRIQ